MPVLVDLGGNSQWTAFEGGGQQNELGGDVWVAHLRIRLQTGMRTRFFIQHTCIFLSHTCSVAPLHTDSSDLCQYARRNFGKRRLQFLPWPLTMCLVLS